MVRSPFTFATMSENSIKSFNVDNFRIKNFKWAAHNVPDKCCCTSNQLLIDHYDYDLNKVFTKNFQILHAYIC